MSHRTGDSIVIGRGQPESTARDDERDEFEGLEELLSDPHCRYLLQYLTDTDGPVPLSAAARHVVGQITDTDPEDVGEDVQRRVQIWLHHGQLPALDDHGVVSFDPESGTVSLVDDSPL